MGADARDDAHRTVEYVRTLAPLLAERVEEALLADAARFPVGS